jgi:glutaredoxin
VRPAPLEVVVYGAPDCHLCDEAKAVLRPAAGRLGFSLREVDISGDAGLEGRYRPDIPVVEIDGFRTFRYRVPEDELERRIAAAQARRSQRAS